MSALLSSAIDRETGREWVEHELSRQEYSDTDLTPLEQLGQWLNDMWDSIVSGALQSNSPWLILIVVVALAAIVALVIWRVRRVGLGKTSLPLSAFDPVVASPEPGPWRDSARAAAERGDMASAVIDSARAIFAVLSQKQIVTLDSASTASELSRTAGDELPEHRRDLTRVARVFNDLLFGEGPAEASAAALNATYGEFLALDETLSALTPRQRSAVAS
ncbi:MAG: DUF4129 domain-containing protein [Brevibacterium sp.]|uniref:DUF4129 domain-containing protein n=1 Tax=Brevibacterium sp. TaxID=1701 RepID=UPI002647FA14|nr:DUF4129 domain-containing protein [Brevibacterium sp.]MDN5806038.1 DUF4129 domain-containing protein [Brevibacterium sp.]MDN5832547.1 DUF4129 domain-containing protein [Brevibacterium sp.]MDN5875206.1 DUF4129 domain-containing protein [Brevibacterium sp.]MDN5908233.1 DUF4129 domain-containing protein [Brevibacterium sp.]MDN6122593.1 DUF4129 domain-containing protein [Brevibacterium sp.]